MFTKLLLFFEIPKNLRTFAAEMKKIVQIILFLALFNWVLPIHAQDSAKADKLFTSGDYSAALRIYRQLYKQHPDLPLYSYRLGRCEQELGMYEDAVIHLTESGTRYSLRALWLARAAFPTYRFELAQTMYEEWLHSADTTHHQYKKAQAELAKTKYLLRYMNRVENILYIDTLPTPINQFKEQDYPILMPDGVTLYYSAKDTEEGMGGWDIYMTKYNPATNTYLVPEMLGMPINSMADDMFYLYDESAGKGFFITNRTNPNRLMLCSFVYNNPKYLRDSSEIYLRDYIQMRTLPRAASIHPSGSHSTASSAMKIWTEIDSLPEWKLVLNDSTIYLSWDNFRSPDAIKSMRLYLKLQKQMAEKSAELEQYRQTYSAASLEERVRLTSTILALETDVRKLRNEADSARKESIRQEIEQLSMGD